MTRDQSIQEERLRNPIKTQLDKTGLYHSFRLPDGRRLDGAMTLEWQEERYASFGLPEDLTGLRALDIGPWDGFYTFEMERRGASVTSIDYVDLDTFRALHRAFSSRADYRRMDVYELDPAVLGTFDIVLCLGVLYHLKHPLLALERICAMTKGTCIIDTYVVDGKERQQGVLPPMPFAEFYEYAELAGQLDNWTGPSVDVVEAWVRSAGFAQAEVRRVTDATACVAAHRTWRNLPPDELPPLRIGAVTCHMHRGRSFRTAKEQYIELWSNWDQADPPALDQVFPEVDGLGTAPLSALLSDGALMASLRLPPGLTPGAHSIRLKVGARAWSERVEVFVDLPEVQHPISIRSIQNGVDWSVDQTDWASEGWLTVWAEGLTPEADAGNTSVLIAGVPHEPVAIVPETGQLNVKLRPLIGAGAHEVAVVHRGRTSLPKLLTVVGEAPVIHGLESLV